MLQSGDQLYNASSGRRFMFLRTTQDTNGEYLRIKCISDADKGRYNGMLHMHPQQTETVLVLAGQMAAVINGQKQIFQAGEEVSIPPGVPHQWWNASTTEKLHVVMEMRPAMQSEKLYEIVCALSQKRNSKPALLHMAVILTHYRDHYQIAGRLAGFKKAFFTQLARWGKRKGYSAEYKHEAPEPKQAYLESL